MDDHPTPSTLRALPEVGRTSFVSRFLPRLSISTALLLALLAIAAGVAVRLLAADELGQRATFIFFVPGVVVASALSGIRAGSLAAVVGAAAGLWCDALSGPIEAGSLIAAAAFVAIFAFDAPFPLIIAAAALVGFLGGHFDPARFLVIRARETTEDGESEPEAVLHTGGMAKAQPTWRGAVRTALIWGSIWAAPIIALILLVGPNHVFTELAVFFSKLAVVTFGGAYAVLAYMAQEAVQTHGWLAPGEMLDGLGMAETTPGPLIQVVQFVGFMGGYREADMLGPVASGIAASVIVTWVTFVPCFLWIFLGAPFIEKLRGVKLLTAALSAVTAAVVGVILNLAIWFALHVAFARLDEVRGYGARLLVPDFATIDVASVVIAAAALIAMLRFKIGMLLVLFVSALIGSLYYLAMMAGT